MRQHILFAVLHGMKNCFSGSKTKINRKAKKSPDAMLSYVSLRSASANVLEEGGGVSCPIEHTPCPFFSVETAWVELLGQIVVCLFMTKIFFFVLLDAMAVVLGSTGESSATRALKYWTQAQSFGRRHVVNDRIRNKGETPRDLRLDGKVRRCFEAGHVSMQSTTCCRPSPPQRTTKGCCTYKPHHLPAQRRVITPEQFCRLGLTNHYLFLFPKDLWLIPVSSSVEPPSSPMSGQSSQYTVICQLS